MRETNIIFDFIRRWHLAHRKLFEHVEFIKEWLSSCFYMNDHRGEVAHILEIKLLRYHKQRTLGLSQTLYTNKILPRFIMQNSKKKISFFLT